MKLKKISFIIPVFNTEEYVKKCIESVIDQTYKNIEIIVIDDGSTDNSLKICNEIGMKDNRIKIYHKENGGLSSARNYGIKKASGDYLYFLDSDDYIPLDSAEVLINISEKYNSDIVIGNYQKVYENQKAVTKEDNISEIKEFNKYEAVKNMFYEIDFSTGAMMKLFKKELFNKIEFPLGKKYEDLATIYKVFFKAKRITYTNKIVYYYLIRKSSIIGSINPLKNIDYLEIALEINKYVKDNVPELIKASEYKIFTASIELYLHFPNKMKLDKDQIKLKINLWNNVKKYRIQVLLDKNSSKKYKILSMVSFFGKSILRIFFDLIAKR